MDKIETYEFQALTQFTKSRLNFQYVDFFIMTLQQGSKVTYSTWKIQHFSEFLSNFGGLAISILGVLNFFLQSYQNFV